jgi:hypothetical protein
MRWRAKLIICNKKEQIKHRNHDFNISFDDKFYLIYDPVCIGFCYFFSLMFRIINSSKNLFLVCEALSFYNDTWVVLPSRVMIPNVSLLLTLTTWRSLDAPFFFFQVLFQFSFLYIFFFSSFFLFFGKF